jgi:hypothetical protein
VRGDEGRRGSGADWAVIETLARVPACAGSACHRGWQSHELAHDLGHVATPICADSV